MPDELHLMLRVTDVLTRNLITAAIAFDWAATNVQRASFDIKSGQMIINLLTAIRSCGVTFDIWPNKTTVFDFTSLMGKEKVKLLDSLPQKLDGCQPDEFCGIVQKIWNVR